MLKRFIVAFVIFVVVIIPGAFALALLAASAYPAPLQAAGCERAAGPVAGVSAKPVTCR